MNKVGVIPLLTVFASFPLTVSANSGGTFSCRMVVPAFCEEANNCEVLFDDENRVQDAEFGKPVKKVNVGDKVFIHGLWHTISRNKPMTSDFQLMELHRGEMFQEDLNSPITPNPTLK